MSVFRAFMKIRDRHGVYETEFREITKYVEKIGDIGIDTDSSDFQIGVFRNANVSISLNNREGIFSDVGQPTSIFPFERKNSIVRLTYNVNNEDVLCGMAICGEAVLAEDVTVFEGLLSDENFLEDAKSEKVTFSILGYESTFANVQTPFADFTLTTNKALIYLCLNQPEITQYLTVDLANIDPSENQTLDDIASFENTTVKEAIDKLVNSANSVLRIVDATVYVASREPTVAIQHTFYGQMSQIGIENIADVKNISNGINRTFNFIRWQDTTLAVDDGDSIRNNGVRLKEINYDFFTDTNKRLNILNAIVDEFGNPKQELDLVSPLVYDTLALNLLDRVRIDYPTVLIAWENNPFPVCGVAICGEAVLPRGLWSLTIPITRNFKIIKKTISTSKQTLTYKMREI